MDTTPLDPAPQPATPSNDAAEGVRRVRPPLAPAHVGQSIGEDSDPEQDVAPNLGGEEQMQDA